ncbi:hypothetical protein QBC98_005591 [Kitasatospora acidiphila]
MIHGIGHSLIVARTTWPAGSPHPQTPGAPRQPTTITPDSGATPPPNPRRTTTTDHHHTRQRRHPTPKPQAHHDNRPPSHPAAASPHPQTPGAARQPTAVTPGSGVTAVPGPGRSHPMPATPGAPGSPRPPRSVAAESPGQDATRSGARPPSARSRARSAARRSSRCRSRHASHRRSRTWPAGPRWHPPQPRPGRACRRARGRADRRAPEQTGAGCPGRAAGWTWRETQRGSPPRHPPHSPPPNRMDRMNRTGRTGRTDRGAPAKAGRQPPRRSG